MKLLQLLFVVCISAFCSCSSWHIEKRHYRNGFYFNRGDAASIRQTDSGNKADTLQVTPAEQDRNGFSEAICDTTKPALKAGTSINDTPANNVEENCREENSVEDSVFSDVKPPEDDPVERQIKITKILGWLALILVIIGLAGLEVTAFTLPLLLIGIGCAIFGLKMGSLALRSTKSKTRDKDGNRVPDPKHIRAKRAYWLSLAAILLAAAYVAVRVIAAGGVSSIVIACVLLGICLLAFLLFKMGVFSDLSDQ